MQITEQTIQYYLKVCECQRRLSPKTVKAYRIDLKQLLQFLADQELNKETLACYIVQLNQAYKPRSVKRKIASTRAFFQFLEDEEILEFNPFQMIRIKIQEPKVLPRTIPLRVIESMLRDAHTQLEQGEKRKREIALCETAIMELLFATGIRVSELCGLNVEDVDLTDGQIKIWGKGAKERLLQIENPSVLSVLKQYSAESGRTASQPFFVNRRGARISEQSVRLILRHYTESVAPSMHITPHMFRHSFATLLLEADVDIRYIQRMLGHSSIVTTQIYTEVAISKQREILKNKHPRNQMEI